jgi:hypothetical protein
MFYTVGDTRWGEAMWRGQRIDNLWFDISSYWPTQLHPSSSAYRCIEWWVFSLLKIKFVAKERIIWASSEDVPGEGEAAWEGEMVRER